MRTVSLSCVSDIVLLESGVNEWRLSCFLVVVKSSADKGKVMEIEEEELVMVTWMVVRDEIDGSDEVNGLFGCCRRWGVRWSERESEEGWCCSVGDSMSVASYVKEGLWQWSVMSVLKWSWWFVSWVKGVVVEVLNCEVVMGEMVVTWIEHGDI